MKGYVPRLALKKRYKTTRKWPIQKQLLLNYTTFGPDTFFLKRKKREKRLIMQTIFNAFYRQAIMAFKCISGHAPKYLSSQFITREQVTKRTTRSGQKLDIPLFKTASGQRTFYYRTIGLWNNLDPFLKSSCSVQVFKRILKNKLLDNFVNTP